MKTLKSILISWLVLAICVVINWFNPLLGLKTAKNGFKVDDYIYPQFNNYVGDTGDDEIGSTPYISGNVLSIRFGNDISFVVGTPNSAISWIDKTNVKVKLILTALIEEV